MTETWRQKIVRLALLDWAKDIREADAMGRAWIGVHIILPIAGVKAEAEFIKDPSTYQYCGAAVRYWLLAAGMTKIPDVGSAGRCLYRFAGSQKMALKQPLDPAWFCVPGDILVRQNSKGGWHGHVMLVVARMDDPKKAVLVVEGNGKGWTPSRTDVQGITLRWITPEDLVPPTLWWVVAPLGAYFA